MPRLSLVLGAVLLISVWANSEFWVERGAEPYGTGSKGSPFNTISSAISACSGDCLLHFSTRNDSYSKAEELFVSEYENQLSISCDEDQPYTKQWAAVQITAARSNVKLTNCYIQLVNLTNADVTVNNCTLCGTQLPDDIYHEEPQSCGGSWNSTMNITTSKSFDTLVPILTSYSSSISVDSTHQMGIKLGNTQNVVDISSSSGFVYCSHGLYISFSGESSLSLSNGDGLDFISWFSFEGYVSGARLSGYIPHHLVTLHFDYTTGSDTHLSCSTAQVEYTVQETVNGPDLLGVDSLFLSCSVVELIHPSSRLSGPRLYGEIFANSNLTVFDAAISGTLMGHWTEIYNLESYSESFRSPFLSILYRDQIQLGLSRWDPAFHLTVARSTAQKTVEQPIILDLTNCTSSSCAGSITLTSTTITFIFNPHLIYTYLPNVNVKFLSYFVDPTNQESSDAALSLQIQHLNVDNVLWDNSWVVEYDASAVFNFKNVSMSNTEFAAPFIVFRGFCGLQVSYLTFEECHFHDLYLLNDSISESLSSTSLLKFEHTHIEVTIHELTLSNTNVTFLESQPISSLNEDTNTHYPSISLTINEDGGFSATNLAAPLIHANGSTVTFQIDGVQNGTLPITCNDMNVFLFLAAKLHIFSTLSEIPTLELETCRLLNGRIGELPIEVVTEPPSSLFVNISVPIFQHDLPMLPPADAFVRHTEFRHDAMLIRLDGVESEVHFADVHMERIGCNDGCMLFHEPRKSITSSAQLQLVLHGNVTQRDVACFRGCVAFTRCLSLQYETDDTWIRTTNGSCGSACGIYSVDSFVGELRMGLKDFQSNIAPFIASQGSIKLEGTPQLEVEPNSGFQHGKLYPEVLFLGHTLDFSEMNDPVVLQTSEFWKNREFLFFGEMSSTPKDPVMFNKTCFMGFQIFDASLPDFSLASSNSKHRIYTSIQVNLTTDDEIVCGIHWTHIMSYFSLTPCASNLWGGLLNLNFESSGVSGQVALDDIYFDTDLETFVIPMDITFTEVNTVDLTLQVLYENTLRVQVQTKKCKPGHSIQQTEDLIYCSACQPRRFQFIDDYGGDCLEANITSVNEDYCSKNFLQEEYDIARMEVDARVVVIGGDSSVFSPPAASDKSSYEVSKNFFPFHASMANFLVLQRCPIEGMCNGGIMTTSAFDCPENFICIEGHTGLFCTECQQPYHRIPISNACVGCLSKAVYVIISCILCLCGAVVGTLLIVYGLPERICGFETTTLKVHAIVMSKLGLAWTEVFSVMMKMTSTTGISPIVVSFTTYGFLNCLGVNTSLEGLIATDFVIVVCLTVILLLGVALNLFGAAKAANGCYFTFDFVSLITFSMLITDSVSFLFPYTVSHPDGMKTVHFFDPQLEYGSCMVRSVFVLIFCATFIIYSFFAIKKNRSSMMSGGLNEESQLFDFSIIMLKITAGILGNFETSRSFMLWTSYMLLLGLGIDHWQPYAHPFWNKYGSPISYILGIICLFSPLLGPTSFREIFKYGSFTFALLTIVLVLWFKNATTKLQFSDQPKTLLEDYIRLDEP